MTPKTLKIDENETFRQRMAVFIPNRATFPIDELEKFRDQYVAFNPEGTLIVAATAQLEDLSALVQAAGYDPEICPVEFVP